jgi:hypothetical protein
MLHQTLSLTVLILAAPPNLLKNLIYFSLALLCGTQG